MLTLGVGFFGLAIIEALMLIMYWKKRRNDPLLKKIREEMEADPDG